MDTNLAPPPLLSVTPELVLYDRQIIVKVKFKYGPGFIVSLLFFFASLGFLMFNFPPARLFMGDVGSAPLGYLAGGLTLWGTRKDSPV